MFERVKTYLARRKANNVWKEEKRKKWLAEGMPAQEVRRRLKAYKVHF